jgi:rhodanese-related sulfurtransferase
LNLIMRDELRGKLERGDDFRLVMTLSSFAYGAKRIPSSLHFETVDETLAALDPADEIVVYCADPYCAASIYAYRLLERSGYTRVRRYAGGISDWEAAGYPLVSGERELPPARPSPRPARPTLNRPWRLCA